PSNLGDYMLWNPSYDYIRKSNIFLQRIDEIPNADDETIEAMKAQARFIRAQNYANLINWYSWWEGDNNGVPLITEPFELGDEFTAERASYSEVLDFIVSEVD